MDTPASTPRFDYEDLIMKRQVWLTTLIGLLAIGCGDDVVATTDTDTDSDGTTSTSTDPTVTPGTSSSSTGIDSETESETDPDDTDTDPDNTTTSGPTTDTEDTADTEDTDDTTDVGEPADFIITIENISDQGPLPTPFSPGVWTEQDSTVAPFFSINTAAGAGLMSLAEDGDASALAAEVDGLGGVFQSGVFDTPVDGAGPAPIMPGESYTIEFTAEPESRLGLASMMVASNDVFWATGPAGVSLFLGNGDPVDRDITSFLNMYDGGSEANQPPGGGFYQPQPGGDPNVGPDESGVVSMRDESTRAIVAARRLMDVSVELLTNEDNTEFLGYEFTFENISGDTGGSITPLSPIAYALHDDTVALITPGGAASDLAGLEALAEDGDATELAATLTALGAVADAGVAGPVAGGPILPGDTVTFTVLPDIGSELLSIGTMVVRSNDAVIAMHPEGVALLGPNEDGDIVPRSPSTIANEILASIEVWDVGTEANETPGAGANQPEIGGPATGDDDADATIRYYNDPTNDLATISDELLIDVSINPDLDGGVLSVDVEIFSFSEGTAFEYTISPGVAALTPEGVSLFAVDAAASAGLESLAEDGAPATFITELDAATEGEVLETPPVPPGGDNSFTFAPPTAANPVLHFAAMIVPSNDTFLATGPDGVNIFTPEGDLLTEEEIAAAILASLQVYDGGTEQNQAGATGRDMAGPGLQAGPNTGADEGNGLVRIVTSGANGALSNEPVWEYPRIDQLIRVTVSPAR